jgi:3',5'-cyclic AMP phosphodiesterase CpdA
VFAVAGSQDGAESAAAESAPAPALPVAWNAPRIVTNPDQTPPLPNAVRFVCVSDTHNKDAALRLPRGHVLLHAGDFSNVGLPKEVEAFAQWLASQDGFAHKIVIAGNHDLPFDAVGYADRAARFRHPRGVDPQVLRCAVAMPDVSATNMHFYI